MNGHLSINDCDQVRRQLFCKACGASNFFEVLNLGLQPPANSLTKKVGEGLKFPLELRICVNCNLGQLSHFVDQKLIFNEYKYLSSVSSSWLQHCKSFAELAVKKLSLKPASKVIEVASNDGYLLQYFQNYQVSPLGIEPSVNVAKRAIDKGIPTITEFFDYDLALDIVCDNGRADLVIANNVLAHVPDIKDFAAGLAEVCSYEGVISIENPSLINLLLNGRFDTIYHEHFSYLSLTSVSRLFKSLKMEVFDVESIPTHGGSLRYWIAHKGTYNVQGSVQRLLQEESSFNVPELVQVFKDKTSQSLKKLLDWLDKSSAAGKKIVGFGAAAKTTVLLNTLGEKSRLIQCVVDSNPEKQGHYIPGVGIPIENPSALQDIQPTDILIFPWNLVDEISHYVRLSCSFNPHLWTLAPDIVRI